MRSAGPRRGSDMLIYLRDEGSDGREHDGMDGGVGGLFVCDAKNNTREQTFV